MGDWTRMKTQLFNIGDVVEILDDSGIQDYVCGFVEAMERCVGITRVVSDFVTLNDRYYFGLTPIDDKENKSFIEWFYYDERGLIQAIPMSDGSNMKQPTHSQLEGFIDQCLVQK